MRRAPLRDGFKVDAGGPPTHTHPICCRDRAPDFVWVPQAKMIAPNRAN